MAKLYAVRVGQRISVRYPFLYHGEGFHGKGHLWDLSASGGRATGDYPVTQGMVMPVYIELPIKRESPRIYSSNSLSSDGRTDAMPGGRSKR